jgi:hypothetical protein
MVRADECKTGWVGFRGFLLFGAIERKQTAVGIGWMSSADSNCILFGEVARLSPFRIGYANDVRIDDFVVPHSLSTSGFGMGRAYFLGSMYYFALPIWFVIGLAIILLFVVLFWIKRRRRACKSRGFSVIQGEN